LLFVKVYLSGVLQWLSKSSSVEAYFSAYELLKYLFIVLQCISFQNVGSLVKFLQFTCWVIMTPMNFFHSTVTEIYVFRLDQLFAFVRDVMASFRGLEISPAAC